MDKEFLIECLSNGMSTRDIEKIYPLSCRTIAYWVKKYGLEDMYKYKKLPSYSFEKIDTKDKAYTLGFILADGSINDKSDVEISISVKDKEVVEYIASVINGKVTYDYRLDRKAKKFPNASTKKRIHDITKFTGGYVKKDRHYPRVRDDLERYLILGLFDADGCITWGRRKDKNRIWQKVTFTSQYKILEGVQKYLLHKLNIATSVKPKGKEDCYILEFSNKPDVLKFCEHIYPDDSFIILHRKYLRYNALRLELEENGESGRGCRQYRAEPAEQEGVETSGGTAMCLNNHSSIQGCAETQLRDSPNGGIDAYTELRAS